MTHDPEGDYGSAEELPFASLRVASPPRTGIPGDPAREEEPDLADRGDARCSRARPL
jgi:hypothetical protein